MPSASPGRLQLAYPRGATEDPIFHISPLLSVYSSDGRWSKSPEEGGENMKLLRLEDIVAGELRMKFGVVMSQ